uniref:Uncharacterized protein n=1 Tax=viral metagenome TaxID=1070528 RepID=A0A6C0CFL6_9ZZZZ
MLLITFYIIIIIRYLYFRQKYNNLKIIKNKKKN